MPCARLRPHVLRPAAAGCPRDRPGCVPPWCADRHRHRGHRRPWHRADPPVRGGAVMAGLTDPAGRVFVSYRRTRAAEVSELLRALHDRGVPTWLDPRNLAAEPTGDELRRVLRDPATAAAVLYLTPEVVDSSTIREIEAPSIMRRHGRDDGFWV